MKSFTRPGVLTGLTATLTMDCLSAIAHRLGVTAPLRPYVIGRWFVSVLRRQPFHSDIAQSPAVRNETGVALAGHYAIGITLACLG